MNDKKIKDKILPIRTICQKAEFEMEKHWAKYFNSKADISYESLKEFWYFKQYYQISLNENNLIKNNKIKCSDIVFIGSGPLPMSGIIINKLGNYKLHFIDKDEDAINLSKSFCSKINNNIKYIHNDALEVDYSSHNLVFVASMVSNKRELLHKLYNDKVEHIIIRDAKGFSKLFYEELENDVFEKYKIKDISKANGLTINTSYLLERR